MYLLVKQWLFLYVTFYFIIDTHFLHIRTNVMVNKIHKKSQLLLCVIIKNV